MITRINTYEIGLVFKNNRYMRTLTEGFYFTGFTEKVFQYDMTMPFIPLYEMDVLLKDERLTALLKVIIISDNEIGILYRNGNFSQVLAPGRYAYFKEPVSYTFEILDTQSAEMIDNRLSLIMAKPALVNMIRAYVVEPFEKGLLMVNGTLVTELAAGNYLFFKNTNTIQVLKADLRQQQLEIPGQEILTRDKSALRINFFAQYKVTDVTKVLCGNKEADKQMYYILQQALRGFTGLNSLDELLEKKNEAGNAIPEMVSDSLAALGYELITCGIRDIILPGDIKEIMNQVLIAEKKAQANAIMRREETAAMRSMLNNAKMIEENDTLRNLKEMEYVERIADKMTLSR